MLRAPEQRHEHMNFSSHLLLVPIAVLGMWSTLDPLALGPAVDRATPPALTLPPQIDLAALLDLAAAANGVLVEYDPAALRGQNISVRAGAPMAASDLWPLLHRALAQRQLALITPRGVATGTPSHPRPVTLSLVTLEQAPTAARTEPIRSSTSADALATPAGFVIQPVRLSNLRPSAAIAHLAARLRMTTASASGEPDVILLIDDASRVAEALAVLADADTPDAAIVLETYAPQHADAAVMLARVGAALQPRTESPARLPASRSAASSPLPGTPAPVTDESIAGSLSLAPDGGTLLISAPRRAVERWRAILAAVDQPAARVTQTYFPRGSSAPDAARLLAERLAPAPDRREPAPDLRVDPASGAVTLTATSAQHEAARALLEALAAEPASQRTMRILPVRNRPAEEVASMLERLIASGIVRRDGARPASRAAAGSDNTAASPATFPLVPGIGPGRAGAPVSPSEAGRTASLAATADLTLTADEPTSSIIALGEPRAIDQLEKLLAAIDTRQPQVMLEAVLVSLSQSDSLALGLELERLGISNELRWRLSSLFGLSSATTINNQPSRDGGAGSGFTGVLLDPGDFSVILRAVKTVSDGRTISMPRVLVTSNQQASFNSVVQQPFAASFTAGNASTPTTSFGGTQDAGTTLSIKPQVTDADTLLLDYTISISSFVGNAASANLPPPRQVTTVQSQAVVPDGFSIVVGGLEVTSDGESDTRVPVLGDVPLLGELFRNRSTALSRSRFFVFIRATTLRDERLLQLRELSTRAAEAAGLPATAAPEWTIPPDPPRASPPADGATP
jgi:general secretion pathway protein D